MKLFLMAFLTCVPLYVSERMSITTQNQKTAPTSTHMEFIFEPGKIFNLQHASGSGYEGLSFSGCKPLLSPSLALCQFMLCGIHER